jgi:predicted nucleotidyltransferase
MGVCIERNPEYVIGLRSFEQSVHRTQPEGVRSGVGDVDETIYSLRKFCRLALNGNPTVILPLYAEPVEITDWGYRLREIRDAFASRRAGRAFLGYMTQQRERLLGERGQRKTNRPELIEAHGFDTKYAMHMLRLGLQGVEYLTHGHITLPMPELDRSYVFSVREGKIPQDEVVSTAIRLERELESLLETSPLPPFPDYDQVNAFIVEAYRETWAER